MFAAELESLLLTAAHDLNAIAQPIVVDATEADERFVGIAGQEHVMRAGDMCMRDASGVISAVVYGPDQRTRLSETTCRVLFTTYAPADIDDALLRSHMTRIAELVAVLAPDAQPYPGEIFG
jgi:DNA/RNA-binding domain of Phe-tRNA-synthetase-like protein